jgi:hypothetical protein
VLAGTCDESGAGCYLELCAALVHDGSVNFERRFAARQSEIGVCAIISEHVDVV